MKMGEHQVIEQSQNREQERHLKKEHQYRHSLQEKKHLEIKINQNMIILIRSTSLKEKQVGREIPKDHLLLKKIKTTPHDTEKDE